MIWLALSILSSVGIFVSFGFFGRWGVDNRLGVAVNYSSCAVAGLLIANRGLPRFDETWWLPALLLGSAFPYLFVKMAKLTQSGGLALSTIASQMSLVLPVALAPWLYLESMSGFRVAGIALGLLSIALLVRGQSAPKLEAGSVVSSKSLVDTLIIFIGTGLCTALVKYSRVYFVPPEDEILFVSCVFGVAAFWTWAMIIRTPKPSSSVARLSLWAGLMLGLPNLGSLVFLIRALGSGLDSALVFPLNNLGIVLFSSLAGWFLFHQALHRVAWFGIAVALAAVALMGMG